MLLLIDMLLSLLVDLQSTKKNGLFVDAYALGLKNLANNLIAAGDSVTEQDSVRYVLGGLDGDFQPISTIFGIRP